MVFNNEVCSTLTERVRELYCSSTYFSLEKKATDTRLASWETGRQASSCWEGYRETEGRMSHSTVVMEKPFPTSTTRAFFSPYCISQPLHQRNTTFIVHRQAKGRKALWITPSPSKDTKQHFHTGQSWRASSVWVKFWDLCEGLGFCCDIIATKPSYINCDNVL